MNAQQFPYLYAFNRLTGSTRASTQRELKRAQRSCAPSTAVAYSAKRKRWTTFNELESLMLRLQIAKMVHDITKH